MSELKESLNWDKSIIDPDHDLSDRDRVLIERMAGAVKICVDNNQCLNDWLIGKAVFMEFKGEFEQLDDYIEEHNQA